MSSSVVPAFGLEAILRRLRHLFTDRNLLTESAKRRRRSLFIRHVDGGSCNDCELEIAALENAVYDLERFGFRLVASPRHADLMLLTGPLTRSMEAAVLTTFEAMPRPRYLITIGEGFGVHSPYATSYALVPLPVELAPAWIAHVLGDPPTPAAIMEVLRSLEIT